MPKVEPKESIGHKLWEALYTGVMVWVFILLFVLAVWAIG